MRLAHEAPVAVASAVRIGDLAKAAPRGAGPLPPQVPQKVRWTRWCGSGGSA
jgi:hypothetical protein